MELPTTTYGIPLTTPLSLAPTPLSTPLTTPLMSPQTTPEGDVELPDYAIPAAPLVGDEPCVSNAAAKPARDRLLALRSLRTEGLVSDTEYEETRKQILEGV